MKMIGWMKIVTCGVMLLLVVLQKTMGTVTVFDSENVLTDNNLHEFLSNTNFV